MISSITISPKEEELANGRSEFKLPTYYLTNHTFITIVGSDIILLDLKSDSYLQLESNQIPIFLNMTVKCTNLIVNLGDHFLDYDRRDQSIVKKMTDTGLLTTDLNSGKQIDIIQHQETYNDLLLLDLRSRIPHIILNCLRVFIDISMARISLRFRKIDSVVRNVRQARREKPNLDCKIIERITTYKRLSPMFMTKKGRCLADSLALMRYLNRFGIAANWYFGVQTKPFLAHCWVGSGNTVYSDDIESVVRYSIIMVV